MLKSDRIVEPVPDRMLPPAMQQRLMALERVMISIENELSDDEISDEQKLQNIGERVAGVMDGS